MTFIDFLAGEGLWIVICILAGAIMRVLIRLILGKDNKDKNGE